MTSAPSATFFGVNRRLALVGFLALLAGWAFFRPRAVRCPQCKGRGAPPLLVNGELRARICATCGASSTPDLPLVGEADPVRDEA